MTVVIRSWRWPSNRGEIALALACEGSASSLKTYPPSGGFLFSMQRVCPTASIPCAKQQTRIAIRIEPVPLPDRMGIGVLHGVEAREGRHQHEQRRAGQMEIRQQNIDRAKAIAGRDED